ncbi:hypothetical protein CDAR_416911 [Caerostris darwini]|uniref:Uncharacterized protein n=1 Tax=Caerostris darwini TaxID=1538125 RepID=A0AAV4X946_9ARAC|nr:hypothetical protein CDAR_416911 [Caerostris darwini]
MGRLHRTGMPAREKRTPSKRILLLFYRSIKLGSKKLPFPGRDRELETLLLPDNSFPDGYPALSCPEVRQGAKLPFYGIQDRFSGTSSSF